MKNGFIAITQNRTTPQEPLTPQPKLSYRGKNCWLVGLKKNIYYELIGTEQTVTLKQ